MVDTESRLEKLERYVNMLLIVHANPDDPMTEEECTYVKAMMQRVGWRGYQLAANNIQLDAAMNKHQALKAELEQLEHDYPELKEK